MNCKGSLYDQGKMQSSRIMLEFMVHIYLAASTKARTCMWDELSPILAFMHSLYVVLLKGASWFLMMCMEFTQEGTLFQYNGKLISPTAFTIILKHHKTIWHICLCFHCQKMIKMILFH